ncbi:hypothetical protein HID58_025904 [Brassica napus]|uniref:Uncharacterized protein n=1 Tax=Brassica napus TaxID=3708 RepID=A0ABQ8CMF7_BRANA|nr:hypothetical protein HID58_025904 [Brassica napus]
MLEFQEVTQLFASYGVWDMDLHHVTKEIVLTCVVHSCSEIIDPAAIFSMLYGSEHFEEYIGQLDVVLLRRKEREEKLAHILKDRLNVQPICHEQRQFISNVKAEVARLSNAAYCSPFIIHTFSFNQCHFCDKESRLTSLYIYSSTAYAVKDSLGRKIYTSMYPFVAEWFWTKGHLIKSQVTAATGSSSSHCQERSSCKGQGVKKFGEDLQKSKKIASEGYPLVRAELHKIYGNCQDRDAST